MGNPALNLSDTPHCCETCGVALSEVLPIVTRRTLDVWMCVSLEATGGEENASLAVKV
jgi:hypothetical protein